MTFQNMDIDHLDKHKNKCYKEHVTFTFRKCIHTYKENVTHDVTHTFMAKKYGLNIAIYFI